MDPAEHSWKAAQASIIIGMEDSGVGENDNRFTALCGYGSRLAFADVSSSDWGETCSYHSRAAVATRLPF